MKKLLLSISAVLVIILTGITVVKGLEIGELNILGITEIKEKNDDLDTTIQQATKLASTDYQKKMDSLDEATKKLETEKSTYEDMVNVSTESEIQAANQSYDYDYDFLWIRIGNHAKTEGVSMKMVITRNASGVEDIYNLNITATGAYAGISEFITNIEDDDRLGFKIEDFKMTAESSENSDTLQATFTCKNIKIKGLSSNTVTTTTDSNDTSTSNTTTENTNTVQ